MTKPIVTSTGYAMLTQDQLLTEIQRLEGLVASVTAERDEALRALQIVIRGELERTEQRDIARDIAIRSGYFLNHMDANVDVARARLERPRKPK